MDLTDAQKKQFLQGAGLCAALMIASVFDVTSKAAVYLGLLLLAIVWINVYDQHKKKGANN